MNTGEKESAQEMIAKAISMLVTQNKNDLIDYDKIAEASIKAVKKEQEKMRKNPKVLMPQFEAFKVYGQQVIRALLKRGFLEKYKFDYRKEIGTDGEPITKTKGVIYYRVSEIEEGIEKANVLRGTRAGII